MKRFISSLALWLATAGWCQSQPPANNPPTSQTTAPAPLVSSGEVGVMEYAIAGVIVLIVMGVVCFPEARE